ncbi:hypothetical protein SAMN04487987_10674 [Algibacter pectinivorans]|uniref:Uncharacterized protein n=1 Tax=Algibacter pectinivorans TaxID=870482 RepID=A0A1I1QM95_9FLAO|nr:hypothetical protein SAMN04487987_10674 [Algibacter pectinivorans]
MRNNVTIYTKQWTSCLKASDWASYILYFIYCTDVYIKNYNIKKSDCEVGLFIFSDLINLKI